MASASAPPILESPLSNFSLGKLVVCNTEAERPWRWRVTLLPGIPVCVPIPLVTHLGLLSLPEPAHHGISADARNGAGDPNQGEGRSHRDLSLVLLKVSQNCPLRLILLKEQPSVGVPPRTPTQQICFNFLLWPVSLKCSFYIQIIHGPHELWHSSAFAVLEKSYRSLLCL